MGQITVKDLDDEVVDRLKRQARDNGRSLQAEVRIIIENAAQTYTPKLSMEEARAEIMRLREAFRDREFPDSAELIKEDRDS